MPRKIFSGFTHLVTAASGALGELGNDIQKSSTKILEELGHSPEALLNSFTHKGEVEATISSTYGFVRDGRWVISLRGRVHQKRKLPDEAVAKLVAQAIKCENPNLETIVSRSQNFTDDSRSNQTVVIEFDSDPGREQYAFPKSDLNGLIERDIELSDDRARKLLDAQGQTAWLSFRVVSDGHSGSGRVRLIEPEGLSVVSDIDDTIKVTIV